MVQQTHKSQPVKNHILGKRFEISKLSYTADSFRHKPHQNPLHKDLRDLKSNPASNIRNRWLKIILNCATESFRCCGSVSAALKFMDCTVRFWELPSVTILNQTEVKLNELLVVLFGNPLIDAVKSENMNKSCDWTLSKPNKWWY